MQTFLSPDEDRRFLMVLREGMRVFDDRRLSTDLSRHMKNPNSLSSLLDTPSFWEHLVLKGIACSHERIEKAFLKFLHSNSV